MIWALGSDDHNGQSCNNGDYPLLTTIAECLSVSTPGVTNQPPTNGPSTAAPTNPPATTAPPNPSC